MSKWISADSLINKFNSYVGFTTYADVKRAIKLIQDEPGIDIVRCKECDMSEVYQSDSNGVMARYCKAFTPTRMIADDDYCSYGERRE